MSDSQKKTSKPLIPAKTKDEDQKDPSEYSSENSRDEELKRDRPPHYE
jgi:hypothetical protein